MLSSGTSGTPKAFFLIPEGKCTFPLRVIKNYMPTGIAGSVFKLIGLARQMKNENLPPQESTSNALLLEGKVLLMNPELTLLNSGDVRFITLMGAPKERCILISMIHI